MNSFTRLLAIVIIGGILYILVSLLNNRSKLSDIPHIEKENELPVFLTYKVKDDVLLKDYFQFMDKIVVEIQDTLPYHIDEYKIVRLNAWLLDSLANTDYYIRKKNGEYLIDSKDVKILKKGDVLEFPHKAYAEMLLSDLQKVWLDINLPSFSLRIMQEDSILYRYPIRVGQYKTKYLSMAGREVDLRTRTGEGRIVRVNKAPRFANPVDNHNYESTLRDDGIRTALPLVPWIEPEINGIRFGQLIHPTTNPKTLRKAYSNGCIGLTEEAMWKVYYYAPIGTKVVIRYDLIDYDDNGKLKIFKDIYKRNKRLRASLHILPSLVEEENRSHSCLCIP